MPYPFSHCAYTTSPAKMAWTAAPGGASSVQPDERRKVFGNFGFAIRPYGRATVPLRGQSSAPLNRLIDAAPAGRLRPCPSRSSRSEASRSDLFSSVETAAFSSSELCFVRARSCACCDRAATSSRSRFRASAASAPSSRRLAASSSSSRAKVRCASS